LSRSNRDGLQLHYKVTLLGDGTYRTKLYHESIKNETPYQETSRYSPRFKFASYPK
jgi:hypothetical protein